MKPDGDAPPEGGEWEPEELLVALTQLVTEGRTPEASVKGRAEGPHCPQRAAGRHGTHVCNLGSEQCRLYQLTRARVLLLWRNAVPVMVEVGLRAGCCAGGERRGATCGSDAGDAEGGPCGRGSLLLERWALHLAPRRSGEGAVSEGTLLQAVRSYIHFSQLSAWLSAAHGKLNHSIFYRVCAPGEATEQDFAESPEEHVFPVPALACTRTLRVSVSALPRLPSPPAVQCRVHAPLRPAAVSSSSAVSSAGAPEPGAAAEPRGTAPRLRLDGAEEGDAESELACRAEYDRFVPEAEQQQKVVGKMVLTYIRSNGAACERCDCSRTAGCRRRECPEDAAPHRTCWPRPAGQPYRCPPEASAERRTTGSLRSALSKNYSVIATTAAGSAATAAAAEPASELAREAKESSPLGSIYQSREIISSIAQQIDLCELETSLRAVRLGAARDLRRKAESPPAPERCRPGAALDGTAAAAPPSSSWRNLKNTGDARAGTPPLTPPLTPIEAALAGDEPERWTPHGEEPAPGGASGGRGGSETPVSSRGAALPLKARVKRKLLPSPSPHRPKAAAAAAAAAAAEAARAADPCQSPPAKCGVARPGPLPLDGVRTSPRPPGGPLAPAAPTAIPALVPAASGCYLASSPGIPAGQSASCQAQPCRKAAVVTPPPQRPVSRRLLDNGAQPPLLPAAAVAFHPRTGLPAASSPVPFRKGTSGRFDLDASLLHKNGHVQSPKVVAPADEQSGREPLAPHAPCSSPRCLLGNFEECVLNARLPALGSVAGFTAELGASGLFCPRHAVLPVHVSFFSVAHDGAPSPYLGVLGLRSHGCRGYHVPRAGTIQVTLFNPNKTVVKMFVVIYDLRDMPGGHHTFLRQRTFSVPAARRAGAPAVPATPGPGPHARHGTNGAVPPAAAVGRLRSASPPKAPAAAAAPDRLSPASTPPGDAAKDRALRYLIHLRFLSSKSGKIYLHSDIRLLFSRKSMEIDSGAAYELKSYTETPQNPRYSPRL
ncbi:atos homolog protein A [Petromyzon marinus]|uniref:Protein FAM214A n=1 Tax=Petromyzon marinus TaxID=7757 RepID=A0AAJ7T1Z2_PETMA|nr:protein FAM214A [Petromyzon marinus]